MIQYLHVAVCGTWHCVYRLTSKRSNGPASKGNACRSNTKSTVARLRQHASASHAPAKRTCVVVISRLLHRIMFRAGFIISCMVLQQEPAPARTLVSASLCAKGSAHIRVGGQVWREQLSMSFYLPETVSNSPGGFGMIWKCGQNCRNTIRPPRNAPACAPHG